MRVICENCGATYKIPESKLVKEVNKATCRKCGFKMMIRRPRAAVVAGVPPPANADSAATQVASNPLNEQPKDRGLLNADTRVQANVVKDWSDEAPTQVLVDPTGPPDPSPKATRPAPSSIPKPNPVIVQSGKAPSDMLLALTATFASAGGAMLLATNIAGSPSQRIVGLGIALWGAFTCLFLLVTGSLWRQKGNVPISIALATVLSLGGSVFVEVALHGSAGFNLASIPTTPDWSNNAEPLPSEPPLDDAKAVDALTNDGEPTGTVPPMPSNVGALGGDSDTEAARPVAAATPPTVERRRIERAPSTERPVSPPPEEDLDDYEQLEDPPLDDDWQAEEDRRTEMESAAADRAAQREQAREDENRRAEEEQAARKTADRVTAAKAAAAARAAAKSKPSSSNAATMKTLPLTVVDTMVRSNMSIKRCFFSEKQASGEMPRRVNVRFTVLNSGRVSSARVTTDQYKGGTLDSCLGRAFRAIQFPPFQGEAKSMTYPFVL